MPDLELRGVELRDVYLKLGISISDAKRLLIALDHAEIKFNSEEEPEVADAVQYMTEKFYPQLAEILKVTTEGGE